MNVVNKLIPAIRNSCLALCLLNSISLQPTTSNTTPTINEPVNIHIVIILLQFDMALVPLFYHYPYSPLLLGYLSSRPGFESPLSLSLKP